MSNKKIKLSPVQECGGSKTGSLTITYDKIVAKIFEPNATELDDPDKVKASWGFVDDKGRKGFIWCYKYYGEIEECQFWSVDGDKKLLTEIFGKKALLF